MANKLHEAEGILRNMGVPKGQQNERTALCLLALLDLKEDSDWADSANPLIGITPMMDFARKYYQKDYAPNSRETFRRFSMHQLVQAGIALYNPDNPSRPVNSPKAVYQISPAALDLIRAYRSVSYESKLKSFNDGSGLLAERYSRERTMALIPVKVRTDLSINLSPGPHSELIRVIIEDFAPRFLPGATLLYVGDTGEKWGYFDSILSARLGIEVDHHGKMPDVVFFLEDKKWLILIESVTSHGPVDSKRHIELTELFESVLFEKVFVTAFPSRQLMSRYLGEIAWETEVWLSENPSHMIHFNGDKFLGPHK